MVNKEIALSKIRDFILLELEGAAKSTPIIAFAKPVFRRVIDNNYKKLSSILNLLADENNNIDFESLLSEMTTSFLNTNKFQYHTEMLGDILIGNGEVRLNIPIIGKDFIFTTDDLSKLNQMLRQSSVPLPPTVKVPSLNEIEEEGVNASTWSC